MKVDSAPANYALAYGKRLVAMYYQQTGTIEPPPDGPCFMSDRVPGGVLIEPSAEFLDWLRALSEKVRSAY